MSPLSLRLRSRLGALRHGTLHRVVALAVSLGVLCGAAPTSMRSADESASQWTRIPAAKHASEIWSLAARFDSGHLLFANVMVTNVGPGDLNAVAIGHLIAPDGSAYAFRKAKRAREWRMAEDGLRMEIGGSVVFDLREGRRRFHVERDGILVDVAFEIADATRPSETLSGADHGFDLVTAASGAKATLRTPAMTEPIATQGLVAVTHRWMSALESTLVQRRIEFFSLEGGQATYFTEVTTAEGRRLRWIVVENGDNTVSWSENVRATTLLGGEPDRSANQPGTLSVSAPGVSAEIRLAQVVLQDDPIQLLPAPARLLLASHLRQRSVWSTAPFEMILETRPGNAPERRSGIGITNVTTFDPRKSGPVAGLPGAPGQP